MRTLFILLVILGTVISLSGCGIQKSIDDGMAHTNAGLAQMQKSMSAMQANTQTMTDSIGKMDNSLDSTANGMREQALNMSMTLMFSADATRYITINSQNPIPMLLGAQSFVTAATPDELVSIAMLWFAEVNDCEVDGTLTQAQKDSIDVSKLVKLNALELVAALAPQNSIDEIVQKQIVQGGLYKQAALGLLVLRQTAMRDLFLNRILTEASVTLTEYDTAMTYIKALEVTNNYPFFDQLSLKIYGLNKKDLNFNLKLEKEDTSKYVTKLNSLKGK